MKPLKTIAASAFAAFLALCAPVFAAGGGGAGGGVQAGGAGAANLDSAAEVPIAGVKIAAVVNGKIITDFELKSLQRSGMSAEEAFSTIARWRLYESIAAEQNLSAGAAEAAEQAAQIASAHASWPQTLVFQAANAAVLERKIADLAIAQAMLEPPSDAAVREFFAKNLASKGANFAEQAEKIRAFLYNQAAEQAVAVYFEKAHAAARIELF